ncbi:PAS domain-containing protein [Maribrevibacterium harenarium]|uniref:C4-dicarboxylate transport sensor protein DctB n=1 Tax=Maribrevibacterium harenarium TaxID=2589817 RepID=A0A501WWR1_9GAMM|nr:PAS domain-containing protein [Maribrevibacterium harenarium]
MRQRTSRLIQDTRRQPRPLWLYVTVLLVCFVIIWRGGDAFKNQQIDELRLNTQEQMAQLGNVIESAISKYQHMPTLLASNDRVRKALLDELPADIRQLNRELEQINRITEASDSYIIDRNGLTIAASNYRLDTSFVGKNFAFRPYFQEALGGQPGRYYALGTTSNLRGYYFSYPVYHGASVIGVAVVKVDLKQFEQRFNNQGYEFLMLDPDGVVFSSSKSEWLYKVMGELSHEEQTRIAESQRYFDKTIETMPIVSRQRFSDDATVIELLENVEATGIQQEHIERLSFLNMSQPIRLLDFQLALLVPLKTIEEQIALWRAIFAGGVTITVLAFGLARLRRRMLQERSDAIELARHNQAYIREVIQNTQAGLVTLDANYRIESYNPAVEHLVGESLIDIIGQPLQQVFTVAPGHGDRWHAALSDLSPAQPRVVTVEGELRAGNRQAVPVEVTLCEMQLPNRRSHLVTFHDMTERKRYEQDITEARLALEQRVRERTSDLENANQRLTKEIEEHKGTQQELIQTAKLAVLGQLSAGLNHELNQPLTAIRAFAENGIKFLQRERYDKVGENLEQIARLGHHMGDIIARFKVFARKGNVTPSPIDVGNAISGAVRIMEPRFKATNIRIQLPDTTGCQVLGDMVFLEQVLVNLLANAADAILEHKGERKEVSVELEEQPEQVCIKVLDTGTGLSEEALARLFEPFYTSKSSGVGLGLGLSISQRIVEAMGGRLSAQNHPGGGAEFCVTLKPYRREQLVEEI